jgi:pimeloyl-ACP methyl ester carboxylesterase
MKQKFRPIVNSDLIGDFITIELPGFPGAHPKPEPCRVHYLTMGSGEPLLLVHSVAQSIYTWRTLMPKLAESYCVIAIDLPGFGHSDRPLSLNYSMDETADVLVKCLDALGVKKTHALGVTMGALYTMYAAVKYPDRFMKVIALTPGGITERMPKKIRRLEGPFGALFRELYSKKDFQTYLPLFYYDGTICTDTVVDQYYRTCDDHASRQAIMYAIRNFDEEYALDAVKRAGREFFIIWGDEDRLQPIGRIFELKEMLPDSVFHSIRNTGHWMHEEKAAQIAEAADRYIRYQGEEQ